MLNEAKFIRYTLHTISSSVTFFVLAEYKKVVKLFYKFSSEKRYGNSVKIKFKCSQTICIKN